MSNVANFWKSQWDEVTDTTELNSINELSTDMSWPPEWWTEGWDKWDRLNDKEKEIILWDPQWYKVFDVEKNADIAMQQTVSEYGFQGKGDKSDAFRHAIWQALNVQSVGENFTRKWSDAHEYSTPPNEVRTDLYMDVHNNDVGIEIGKNNSSATLAQLVTIIKDQIALGKLIIIINDTLKKSDGASITKSEIRRYNTSYAIAKSIVKNGNPNSKY